MEKLYVSMRIERSHVCLVQISNKSNMIRIQIWTLFLLDNWFSAYWMNLPIRIHQISMKLMWCLLLHWLGISIVKLHNMLDSMFIKASNHSYQLLKELHEHHIQGRCYLSVLQLQWFIYFVERYICSRR